jgi:hypothetical protein
MGYVHSMSRPPYELVWWPAVDGAGEKYLAGNLPALGVNIYGADERELKWQAYLAVQAKGGDVKRGLTMRRKDDPA